MNTYVLQASNLQVSNRQVSNNLNFQKVLKVRESKGNLTFPKLKNFQVSSLSGCFNLSLGNLPFTKRPSCTVSALSKAEADSQYEKYGKKISYGGLIPVYDVVKEYKEYHTDLTENPKPDLFLGKIRWYHFEHAALYYKGNFWSIVKFVPVEALFKATQKCPCTFQLANGDNSEFVNVQFYPDGDFYYCVYRIV
ncbi:uncharacterized protein LOC131624612 [Vicia villosa]|uniref:uncharacterized protein LOC131624612 n=1 Tax=Vicia villosa TaxID=3911 RepID=UPI00273C4B3D|nr:uncharacterized protein LOC131624612 [Vicia villosa]